MPAVGRLWPSEDDDVKGSFVAIMSILISVIITDDGGVTMQRIGLETFAQGYSERLALVFLSSFDFLIFLSKNGAFCIHAKRESGRGCVRPSRRVDRENDLGVWARLARVEKDVLKCIFCQINILFLAPQVLKQS